MRKRKKRFLLVLAVVAIFACTLYYLSSCTEVSYMVQFTSVHKDGIETQLLGGSRFFGPLPQPPELFRKCRTNSDGGVTCICPTSVQSEPEPHLQKCEVIHVAVVCAGFEASRRLTTLVKSLLFHRRNPIHLHLVVDNEAARPSLQTLFATWALSAVEVSFYDAKMIESAVSWIPNRHYSGIYGLLKLALIDLLPKDLEKVLVLDTDILFVADPAELWKLWKKVQAKQAIGLVENMSDWYLGKLWKNQHPWPAIGRGFNTGVILMDLGQLRQIHWMSIWKETAERLLPTLHAVALADQDIFNAVLRERPHLLYRLPCEWNLQLGDRSMQELCLTEVSELKV